MAEGVNVFITDFAIIAALNTPGGAVFEWRNDMGDQITRECRELSPVNNPLNAQHRGGVVGSYKAGWFWTAIGSNGHQVRAVVYNESDHAGFVEYGRGPAIGAQTFSWTRFVTRDKAKKGGQIRTVFYTGARKGRHILRDSTNRALISQGLPPAAV